MMRKVTGSAENVGWGGGDVFERADFQHNNNLYRIRANILFTRSLTIEMFECTQYTDPSVICLYICKCRRIHVNSIFSIHDKKQ